MGNIFICYRRADAEHVSARIYDGLAASFGEAGIFKDVDSIPFGKDFRTVLREAVAECQVMLVLIGPQWLIVADGQGRRRLDNAADYVRMEVEAGLTRGIPVIPVLVQNADMPAEADLPQSMAALAYRHGLSVRGDPHFKGDVLLLMEGLQKILEASPAQTVRPSDAAAPVPPPTPGEIHPASNHMKACADLISKAQACLIRRNYARARTHLQRALLFDPDNPEVWAYISWAESGAHRQPEALSAAERAAALAPSLAVAWFAKGRALHFLGRYQEALSAYQTAIALDPEFVQAIHNVGLTLKMLGREADAVDSYRQAVTIDPKYVLAWENMGNTLAELGRHNEALDAYTHAAELEPGDPDHFFGKAEALHALGRTAEEEEALEAARQVLLKQLGR